MDMGATGRRGLTSADIKAKARELGFDACGIAPASDLPELGFLHEWLARGYGGTMHYLGRSAERRADVRRVVPGARSVIATATVYNTGTPYSTELSDPSRALIARYAWGDDYHAVVERRLDALLTWMHMVSAERFEARRYVDTGPVQERVYARHAGIGWIGKNTCVIHPELGSWILLGEIICNLELEADLPSTDQCGSCTLCIEACPTSALVAPGVLDSNRCVSYLTIEHRGDLPAGLLSGIGSHVFGCDVCQEVCPWNMAAPVSGDTAWQPRAVWRDSKIADLSALSDDELQRSLAGSSMRRAKVAGLRRNIAAAVANANRHGSQREHGSTAGD